MFKNHWLNRSQSMIETELILVQAGPDTQKWFDRMASVIPVIDPDVNPPVVKEDFGPRVGSAHHLRHTRFGIEAVLCAPKKYHHKNSFYVLFDQKNVSVEPFWVIVH